MVLFFLFVHCLLLLITSNYYLNHRRNALVAGMRDIILDFQYLAEGLRWYFMEAFDFIADELLALCLVFASFLVELIGLFFCQILIY